MDEPRKTPQEHAQEAAEQAAAALTEAYPDVPVTAEELLRSGPCGYAARLREAGHDPPGNRGAASLRSPL